jgi:hypothetical protein
MGVCKRILAGLVLLLSVVGLLLSLAAGVGVWIVKDPVTAKATHVFERIEAGLDVADQGLDHVKASLDRAGERLASAREEQRQITRAPGKMGMAQRFLARTVQQRVAPELDNAHEKLHTVAEAALVVNSVLEDVGNFPFLSVAGLDVGDLSALNSTLSRVESSAWELTRLLGEPQAGSDSDTASAQVSRIEETLKRVKGLIADYEPKVTEVRRQTEQLKSWTLHWITPAAVIVSLACFWIALSQVSLLCHAWSWFRH